MYDVALKTEMAGRAVRYRVLRGGATVSYEDVLTLWESDRSFRDFFVSVLRESSFGAFRWETPPISSSTRGRAFEFVLVNAPELHRDSDVFAFREHWSAQGGHDVVVFENLGRDASLIVPSPQAEESAYVHLARFVRLGPVDQVDELWRVVGATVVAQLGEWPLWVNTAGDGVAWLHVRLDTVPKYYEYAPFRRPD